MTRPAVHAGVGTLARAPLSTGLLAGRYTAQTRSAPNEHRSYNRDGSACDGGETFAGIDFDEGVAAAAEFSARGTQL